MKQHKVNSKNSQLKKKIYPFYASNNPKHIKG